MRTRARLSRPRCRGSRRRTRSERALRIFPRPGSIAIRTPFETEGATPVAASRVTRGNVLVDRARALSTRDRLVARNAARKATDTTSAITATMPTNIATASACTPMLGSARRATPKGKRGDTATAPTTARIAPAAAMISVAGSATAMRWHASATKIAQRVLVDRHRRNLTSQDDADRERARQRGHCGRDPQREREHVDRVPRTLRLDRETLRTERAVAEDPPRFERGRAAHRRRHARSESECELRTSRRDPNTCGRTPGSTRSVRPQRLVRRGRAVAARSRRHADASRGPCLGPTSLAPPRIAATCFGEYDSAGTLSPTCRPSRAANPSPIVTSSGAFGSSARPATMRSRSTESPNCASIGAPIDWKSGAAGTTIAIGAERSHGRDAVDVRELLELTGRR